MWALVRTFVPKDLGSENIEIRHVLDLLESALNGTESRKELLASLDLSVERAQSRISEKAEQFRMGHSQKGI